MQLARKPPLRWPPTNRQLVIALMPERPVRVSVADMQRKTGLTTAAVSGVMNILVGEKVFERADEGTLALYQRASQIDRAPNAPSRRRKKVPAEHLASECDDPADPALLHQHAAADGRTKASP
jgi:hypothetical protein